ncbi:hypothetical protein LVDJXP189_380016 [Flavobacterium psychrophilum]|uniref:hypothetical protein n=1 Tax=Flavobacterium psychrophilum TaxID=96345 RepID=UPI0006187CEF|nr:hypothetical protein [Flavobacterium psychrophilum]OAE92019.1 hypothetical protein SU65_09650 [Flavobacterium psychrophilum]SNB43464.1 hypothetical protein LVDJXP189_380016 [Flavobacterium psychrophilum]
MIKSFNTLEDKYIKTSNIPEKKACYFNINSKMTLTQKYLGYIFIKCIFATHNENVYFKH